MSETAAEKYAFSKERRGAEVAIEELVKATGLTKETLTQSIPELLRPDLAFGVMWASDAYDDTPVGRHNAGEVEGYIIVMVPALAVDGRQNDVSGINRSYCIDVRTKEVNGFPKFTGADDYLETQVNFQYERA